MHVAIQGIFYKTIVPGLKMAQALSMMSWYTTLWRSMDIRIRLMISEILVVSDFINRKDIYYIFLVLLNGFGKCKGF